MPNDSEMKGFDGYFHNRLILGIRIIDNDFSHTRKIEDMLKSRGLIH